MRNAQTASVRGQKQMDQRYIRNLAKQIAGECKITIDTMRDFGQTPQSFSIHVFRDVLRRVARMSPQTLGKILAYGLAPNKGEDFETNGRRITSMGEVWSEARLGTVENTTGIMLLEWSAAAVVVAAIYDLFLIKFTTRAIVNSVYKEYGLPPRYPNITEQSR